MTEKFAAYGLELDIPSDWRIEFNPKNTREKGDVAFHSPKRNVFFVSWGKLEEAQRRFKTLEQQRDESVKRVRRNPNIQKADMELSSEEEVSGHEGILSKMVAQRRRGMMSRQQYPLHEVWTLHFHCPQTGRYYIVYWDVADTTEYPYTQTTFITIARSVSCHK